MSRVRAEDSLTLINASALEVTVEAKFIETNAAGEVVNIVGQDGVTYDMAMWDVIDSNRFDSPVYVEGAGPVVASDNRPGS